MAHIDGSAILKKYGERMREAKDEAEKAVIGREFIEDAEMLIRLLLASEDAEQWELATDLEEHVQSVRDFLRDVSDTGL